MIVKKVVIDKANRIYQLPPDIFSFTRDRTAPPLLRKIELLDLARFRWPIAADTQDVTSEACFAKASTADLNRLKETLAEWFLAQHKVKINPVREIFLGGSISDCLLCLALAFIDNGDIVFVPELGVPLYRKVTTACGGQPVTYALSYKTNWQPDFERINTRLGRVARLLFLNSPHNPTGIALNEKEMENLVWMATRENIVIVNDAAYQSVSSRSPVSLMSVDGGKKVGAEVYSFSYLLGLPHLPFGFVVGNKDVISGLESASSLMPAFIPEAYVEMAIAALRKFPAEGLQAVRKHLARSAAEATKLMNLLALEKSNHDTIPFLWTKIEGRRQSTNHANLLYHRSRILTAPGSAFGDGGEGFLRWSLTASAEDYQTALERIKKKQRILKLGEEK